MAAQLEAWPKFGETYWSGYRRSSSSGNLVPICRFVEPEVEASEECKMRFSYRVAGACLELTMGKSVRSVIELHGHIVVNVALEKLGLPPVELQRHVLD